MLEFTNRRALKPEGEDMARRNLSTSGLQDFPSKSSKHWDRMSGDMVIIKDFSAANMVVWYYSGRMGIS